MRGSLLRSAKKSQPSTHLPTIIPFVLDGILSFFFSIEAEEFS